MELELNSLPTRSRPRPPTNKNMPHSQIGIKPVPEVNAELFRTSVFAPQCIQSPDRHLRARSTCNLARSRFGSGTPRSDRSRA